MVNDDLAIVADRVDKDQLGMNVENRGQPDPNIEQSLQHSCEGLLEAVNFVLLEKLLQGFKAVRAVFL